MNTIALSRVLVVDDDPELCSLLSDYLSSNGYQVQTVNDGSALREAMAAQLPDIVVMDLMLPGEDGLSLTRNIKAQWDIPVLMLSARGEEMDRVIGLEVGADDYLSKPFGPRELLARLRALLRRTQAPAPGAAAQLGPSGLGGGATERRRFGSFELDEAGHRLLRDGAEVPLTSAEYALLAVFVKHPGRVLSRDTLIDMLKGYDRDAFDRSVDSRVTRLRRKIETDSAAPLYIRTVRGEGYLFNPNGGDA
jgi:DNA-binding response OmpR family regulator